MALLDESDAVWSGGTKAQLPVKIFEETGAAAAAAKTAQAGTAGPSGNASGAAAARAPAALAGTITRT